MHEALAYTFKAGTGQKCALIEINGMQYFVYNKM